MLSPLMISRRPRTLLAADRDCLDTLERNAPGRGEADAHPRQLIPQTLPHRGDR
jgi:hypothetical protein